MNGGKRGLSGPTRRYSTAGRGFLSVAGQEVRETDGG
jgi:hypothetical protein